MVKINKTLWKLFFVIIFPYLILFTVYLMFFGHNIIEKVFFNNGFYLILALIFFYVIALISAFVFFIKNILSKKYSENILKINMIIKILHIPAYILIFLMGVISFITIFTIGFSIAFIILDMLTIFMTGLIGLSGIIIGFKEKKISIKNAIIFSIFQFIFCIDVFSSIIIYKKIKKEKMDN